MNERIQQLAEQAGAEIYGHPDHATICVNGQDADALMKKFAQLIIRECADIASMNQHQWESTGMYVLKHFGVEQ